MRSLLLQGVVCCGELRVQAAMTVMTVMAVLDVHAILACDLDQNFYNWCLYQ